MQLIAFIDSRNALCLFLIKKWIKKGYYTCSKAVIQKQKFSKSSLILSRLMLWYLTTNYLKTKSNGTKTCATQNSERITSRKFFVADLLTSFFSFWSRNKHKNFFPRGINILMKFTLRTFSRGKIIFFMQAIFPQCDLETNMKIYL